MSNKITKLSYLECLSRAIKAFNTIDFPANDERLKVYGIPCGGMCALLTCLSDSFYQKYLKVVLSPELADIILDDIIDSGATKEKYSKYGKPIIALVNKLDWDEDKHLGWIQFPWEKECIPQLQ